MDQSEGWRFSMKMIVPPHILRKYVDHHDFTVRTLADEVARRTRQSCSHSSIGHLLTGERKTIGDNKARALEEILNVPRGTLFVTTLSRVARDARGKAVA